MNFLVATFKHLSITLPALVEKPKGSLSLFHSSLAILSTIILLGSMSDIAFSQTGTVAGEVVSKKSGIPIEGAEVSLNQKNLQAKSDKDGIFTLQEVPVGDHTLEFNYLGYNELEVTLSVESGNRVELQAELEEQDSGDDEIFATQNRQSISRSLDRMSESVAAGSVVTFQQLDYFGDYSLQDAMIRVPGVQAGKRQEVNVRGVGRNQYNVTIDGQQIATTGASERQVDLTGISTDLIRDVEVLKIPTPDMNANALGGTINLNTTQPLETQRELNVIIGGGTNPEYFGYGGATTRGSVNYSERLHEDLTLSVNLNQQLDQRGRDVMGVGFESADFGDGPVDVLERIESGLENVTHNRLGGRLGLEYQPTDQSSYYFRGVVNTDMREGIRHIDSWNAHGDWIDQSTTGAEGELGSYMHEAYLHDSTLDQYLVRAGATNLMQGIEINYNAGWSHSRADHEDFLFPFEFDEVNFDINMQDRDRPSMNITNRQTLVLDDGSINRNFIIGQNFERTLSEYIDNTFSADVDIELPFSLGEFNVGSSALLTLKEGDYQESSLENTRTLRMERFNMMSQREVDVMGGDYNLPWLVEPRDARTFLRNQRPSFSKDEDLERERSDIRNYEAFEQIYSGYGMATLEVDQFVIMGGIRVEYTAADYEGEQVLMNENGEHENTESESESVGYANLFPNVHVISNHLGEQTRVGAAYSRTLSRPDFNLLAPFELRQAQNETLFQGNPNLDPLTSDNLDFYIDHYFADTGQAGISLFYKNLSNFVVETETTIQSGEFEGWQQRTFENSDEEATVYGAEVSWQQTLDFLPGFLSNFGTYANYTWSNSAYQPEGRNDEITLRHHSPNVVNASLNYTQGRFFTQLTYHWSDEYLNSFQTNRQLAPSINPNEEIIVDQYEQGWSDLSASFRFRISDNFRFWANASNLLGGELLSYNESSEYYPVATDYRNGTNFRMGIRFDL